MRIVIANAKDLSRPARKSDPYRDQYLRLTVFPILARHSSILTMISQTTDQISTPVHEMPTTSHTPPSPDRTGPSPFPPSKRLALNPPRLRITAAKLSHWRCSTSFAKTRNTWPLLKNQRPRRPPSLHNRQPCYHHISTSAASAAARSSGARKTSSTTSRRASQANHRRA